MAAKKRSRVRTTRRQSKEAPGELCIVFRKSIATYVRAMHATGFYGLNVAETVDYAVCAAVRKAIEEGFIPSMEFDDADNVVKIRPLRVERARS